jgi:hypothetical protein
MKAQHHILLPAVIILLMTANGCGSSKNGLAQQEPEYTVERAELTGYGVGVSADENTARGMAMTAALGDLSTKLQAEVRTASSNYQKQTGTANKTLFESLTESVSQNRLHGVTYKGDKSAHSYKNGRYTYRIEARLNQTIFRQNVERILDEMNATADERAAFKKEMFGD